MHAAGATRQGTRLHRRAREAIRRRSQGGAGAARSRLRRRDARGRQAVPGRPRRRHAVRAVADGYVAVELLGAGRQPAAVHERGDRVARVGARAQGRPCRRDPSVHSRRRGVSQPGPRREVRRQAGGARAGRRPHRAHAGTHLSEDRSLQRRVDGQRRRHQGRRGVLRRRCGGGQHDVSGRLLPAQHPLLRRVRVARRPARRRVEGRRRCPRRRCTRT